MYKADENVAEVPDETVIWRYMTVEKYISLLTTSKLFLCRMDKFEDKWEGAWPKRFIKNLSEDLERQGFGKFNNLHNLHQDILFINCWHANEHESAAMWDLYSSKRSGLAIKTTVGALKSSVISEDDFMLGRVEYIDVETDTRTFEYNMIIPAFLKRMSFKHESEIRLVRLATPSSGNRPPVRYPYVELDVDLEKLLQEVYVSPLMPQWLLSSVRELSQKLGLVNSQFVQSSLYDDYLY